MNYLLINVPIYFSGTGQMLYPPSFQHKPYILCNKQLCLTVGHMSVGPAMEGPVLHHRPLSTYWSDLVCCLLKLLQCHNSIIQTHVHTVPTTPPPSTTEPVTTTEQVTTPVPTTQEVSYLIAML